MPSVTFFQKNKIKKRFFKKKHHLISQTLTSTYLEGVNSNNQVLIKNLLYNNASVTYKNISTYNKTTTHYMINQDQHTNTIISLTQKFNNPKGVIFNKKNLNTFSVGSIIKYFKVKHSKCLRRSSRGLNIFINFLKNIFDKKYIVGDNSNNAGLSCLIVNICGFDYNLLLGRKNLRNFLKKNKFTKMYYIYNLKLSFTKKKSKKIKSIKKRLKKKIILNFLKKVNL